MSNNYSFHHNNHNIHRHQADCYVVFFPLRQKRRCVHADAADSTPYCMLDKRKQLCIFLCSACWRLIVEYILRFRDFVVLNILTQPVYVLSLSPWIVACYIVVIIVIRREQYYHARRKRVCVESFRIRMLGKQEVSKMRLHSGTKHGCKVSVRQNVTVRCEWGESENWSRE